MEKDKKKYTTVTSKPIHHAIPDPKIKHKGLNLFPGKQVEINPQLKSEDVQVAVADLNKKFENFLFEQHINSKVTNPITEALTKKSNKSGVELPILEEVFRRGLSSWNPYICKNSTQEQWAFARVNSFISGGKAVELDSDLAESLRKKKIDINNPDNRLDGTTTANIAFRQNTPGQTVSERIIHTKYGGTDEPCWTGYVQKGTKIKNGKVVPNCVPIGEGAESGCPLIDEEEVWDKPNPKKKSKSLSPAQKAKAKARAKAAGRPYPNLVDNMAVAKEEVELEEKSAAWQRKEGKNPKGGLNEKGRKSYERENPGSDLKPPQPQGGARQRSFCARMGGMPGPMKDSKGRPTRKALALRKWRCGSVRRKKR
jgi:hypothetical protein